MISNKTLMQFCTFFFAGEKPQKCLNTHTDRHRHTDTPVNVPQPACSSRWRDSAALSSRTAEEPFLRKGQGGRGGVAKVNKLYKMELFERFEAPPPPGGFDRVVMGKKGHEETATTQSNSLLLLPGYHSPGKDRLLCVIGHWGARTHQHTLNTHSLHLVKPSCSAVGF